MGINEGGFRQTEEQGHTFRGRNECGMLEEPREDTVRGL